MPDPIPTESKAPEKKVSDLAEEGANFWAMSLGFNDADELRQWGEKVERNRLTELAFKKEAGKCTQAT